MSAETYWVIQTGYLGDCALSLPFLHRLAHFVPVGSRIVLITANGGRELFEIALERGLARTPARFEVVYFDKRNDDAGWRAPWRIRARIGGDVPRAVFCLQRSFRTGLLALVSRAPVRLGFSSGAASFLYTHFAARDWDNGRSEVEKNLDLLRVYAEQVQGRSPSDIAEWDTKSAPSLLASGRPARARAALAGRRVLVSIGSPWATKLWNNDNATELCRSLTERGDEVVLVGDAAARERAAKIRGEVPSLLLTDRSGQTTLRELLDVFEDADAMVSNDSAPVHLAADLGLPTVALFGPTIPELGFAPWRRGSVALGVNNLSCRPCHVHGPMQCPLGHHNCMKELKSELVLRHVDRVSRGILGRELLDPGRKTL